MQALRYNISSGENSEMKLAQRNVFQNDLIYTISEYSNSSTYLFMENTGNSVQKKSTLLFQKMVLRFLGHQLSHNNHDDVNKWEHFPRHWPFVRGIHQSPVDSPHKDQWRGALKFTLICGWTNGWANTRGAGDLRRHRVHYDVNVMILGHIVRNLCQIHISTHSKPSNA